MIYTDVQLKEKITCLINEFESEVVEFKEANTHPKPQTEKQLDYTHIPDSQSFFIF